MSLPVKIALLTAALWCAASVAAADPCEAPVNMPKGTAFAGTVHYVGDGDSLCVGISPDPETWIEVRLADFYAPELSELAGQQAKVALERIALGHRVSCVAHHRSYDRIVAQCTVRGESLAKRMRDAGVTEGGRGG